MSKWNKEELENMLEDVVNELELSESAVEKHGQEGTAPSELVRLVLDEKDLRIRALEANFVDASKSNCNIHGVMPMFADESNEGNEKRAELIKDYEDKIQNWKGTYSQGFADCFNWLCSAFKAN
jgi:hypothetical protein